MSKAAEVSDNTIIINQGKANRKTHDGAQGALPAVLLWGKCAQNTTMEPVIGQFVPGNERMKPDNGRNKMQPRRGMNPKCSL
ncbi:MAG: hypothetical protein ABSG10_05250 [Terracidiphilus sp.]